MGTNRRGQIVMTEDEITVFVQRSRTLTLATRNSDGSTHLVAMWYAVIAGVIWLETKAKSQKAVNIRRDSRVSVLIEDGDTYDTLRGVAMEGQARVVTDSDQLMAMGIALWERYYGPYTPEQQPAIEQMMNKRIALAIDPAKTRSWDHRKLGLPALQPTGSTATYL